MHTVYDTDKHFVIDPITREITSTASAKNRVVQHDHNSERFTFELPRYIEGHDMSLCNRVEVHYINLNTAQGTEATGVYEVDDLRIDSEDNEKALCSWLISGNATRIAGVMQFVIRFACVTDGNTDYVWNTAIFSSVNVVKGIHNSEALEQKYIDVLAQWEQRLFSINDDGVSNVAEAQAAAVAVIEASAEAKKQEVLNEIPDDYITLDKNVTEYKKKVGSLANAIKGKLSGAYVRADDVSPIEHEMSVKVRSKNMFSLSTASDINSTYRSWLVNPDNDTLTLSITDKDTSVDISGLYLGFSTNGENGVDGVAWMVDAGAIVKTIRTHSNFKYISIYGASLDAAADALNERFNIQLEKGSAATEYTPYVDPADVAVTKCGKNILPPNYLDGLEKKHHGVTFTVQDDGGVKAVGTATEYAYFKVMNTDLSNLPHVTTDCLFDRNNKLTFIPVQSGATVDKVFYPQVEVGTEATAYEKPITQTTYTVATDGTVLGVTSLSPTMTLTTDTDGVVIDCEYNRDTNAVIADLYEKIAALTATS